jgi:predicted transcriptional regulator
MSSTNITDHGPSGPEKWGEAALAGYQPVPDVLLIKQRELGLDQTDMLVLLNLTSYWWFRDRPPFPRTNVIAKRMGVSPRTVQRALKKLEAKGYIRRADYAAGEGRTAAAVYFEGLIAKLTGMARGDATLSARLLRMTTPTEFSGEGESPF